MRVGLGFWASKTLLSAVELGLFTELARKAGTAEDLQGRLGLHARSTRDFLDALVSLGVLDRKHGTGADCMGWMKECGFRKAYLGHLVGPDSMVVGIK